jgi:hypothetical protein
LVRKLVHIVFSAWLSLLLLLGSTPKEFIHGFANHKDTIDSRSPSKGLTFGNKHHHCAFLSFNLLPFADGFQQPALFFLKQNFQTFHTVVLAVFIPGSSTALSLRGPPVC